MPGVTHASHASQLRWLVGRWLGCTAWISYKEGRRHSCTLAHTPRRQILGCTGQLPDMKQPQTQRHRSAASLDGIHITSHINAGMSAC